MRRKTFNRKAFGRIGALGAALLIVACAGQDEPAPMEDMEEMPGMEGMSGMSGMDHMDPADMEQHAQELEEMVAGTGDHIENMRELSPEQQHERMGEHVSQVSRMLTLMNRQMQEMDMGMGMGDEHMGAMMGMSAEEHRQMIEEMQALRMDTEQLQTATVEEVRERMSPHLERLERMIQMMAQSAGHMRSM